MHRSVRMTMRIRCVSSERAQQIDRAGDAVLLGVASTAAAFQAGLFRWHLAIAMLAASLIPWMVASRALRQYDAENGRGVLGDVALTLVMVVAVVAPISALSVALPHLMPIAYPVRFLLLLLPAVVLLRARVIGLRLWRSRPMSAVLVVGTGPLGRLTGADVHRGRTRRRLGYLRFDDDPHAPHLDAPLLGAAEDLQTVLREHAVDEVYFASTAVEHAGEVQGGIRTCERFGVPFALPACAYRLTRARPCPDSAQADGYAHFTTVRVTPLGTALKRLLDIAVSATLLAVLSPLLVGVAILVRLTSRGPILFKQQRVGLRGRRFYMLKFRSMVENAEELKAGLLTANERSGPAFKIKLDPRITPLGRFLRKYSVDELPQLVNVLRGDMSIVGPRPPLPSEVAQYEGWQRRRLSVRPGLTCMWQVSGRTEISFEQWMLLDMQYIDHWSFARDVGLILRTVPVVLLGRGSS
jgi:exopolysaccharide biosynthesis polyprenyl glycosylphosphotransferase